MSLRLLFDTTSSYSITLPVSNFTYPSNLITVNWGDGTIVSVMSGVTPSPFTHTTPVSGWSGIVDITCDPISSMNFGDGSPWDGATHLLSVQSWAAPIKQLIGAFTGCTALTSVPAVLPAGVLDTAFMFQNATSFNSDISGWDTSTITSMQSMFDTATSFNRNLSRWNTANVVTTYRMFAGATAFNSALPWNMRKNTELGRMFQQATAFSGSGLSTWDVSGVTDMAWMFYATPNFNANLSGWNVGAVNNMSLMFCNATIFNSNLSGWAINNVTNMNNMFELANAFTANLTTWKPRLNASLPQPNKFFTNSSDVDTTTTDIRSPFYVPCFGPGTKILAAGSAWIPIESLRVGDIVKTYLHGLRPITYIYKGTMINNPDVWHTCMYTAQREGFDPLVVTGGHSFLVDSLTESQRRAQAGYWGANSVDVAIDDKVLLLAPVSDEFKQVKNREMYTYYHIVVENDGNDDRRYGVYANGFLTETPSKKQVHAWFD